MTWLGAFDDDRLAGAVAWSETARTVDIDRLVVDPGMHRRGIGARWCARSWRGRATAGSSCPPAGPTCPPARSTSGSASAGSRTSR
ncbi:GNAT family N-acetyltransferase [Streptosporangium lutulentum]